MNHKKLQCLWREEGLRVPVKRRRKRAGTSTASVMRSRRPDQIWGIDFQFDATEDGRPVKILHVIDEYTREILGGIVARSITGQDLADHLDTIANTRGTAPEVLRLDNGPEMISVALSGWCTGRTGTSYSPPGQPWHNPFVESFGSRLRDECLNLHSFWSLIHARVVIADWKQAYNHDRPHSSLGYQTPAAYAATIR